MQKKVQFLMDIAVNIILISIVAIILLRGNVIRVFTVLSGSMEPTISTGSIIVVNTEKKPEMNDIITFRVEDVYVTHRIVEINSEGYKTKGDANQYKDFWTVPGENVTGVVIAQIPFAGYLLQSQLIVIIVCIGCIFFAVRSVWYLIIKKKRGNCYEKYEKN